MKCPNCGVEAPAGSEECGSCGIIFAKFKKKLEAIGAPAETPPYHPWRVRAIALTLVMLWCAGFALYYRSVVADLRRRSPDTRPHPPLIPAK
jgi:hypothetical protein